MTDPLNHRSHYRLQYPPGAAPTLTVDGRPREVAELSERGLRYGDGGVTATLAARVVGTLRFPDGSEFAIDGTVVRAVGGWIALRLTRGVPLNRMLAEQKRILRDYPGFLRPADSE